MKNTCHEKKCERSLIYIHMLIFLKFVLKSRSMSSLISYIPKLFSGTEARGVKGGILGFEAVEAPDECEFKVAGHVVDFHPVVLTGMFDGHGRRPLVENVVSLQIQLTASFLSELPFDPGIDPPDS